MGMNPWCLPPPFAPGAPCARCGQSQCCCPGPPVTSPTAPENPNFGQLWLDNSAGDPPLTKVWNGRVWELIRANATSYQDFRPAGSYTYTVPAGALVIHVRALGAGSGGGSGDRQPSGTAANGGFGGVGGFYQEFWIPASILPATVPIVVGAGGIGGASVTTDSTVGIRGAAGGNSLIGTGGAFGIGLGGGRNAAAGPGNGGGLCVVPGPNAGPTTVAGSTITWFSSVNGGQGVGANGNGGGQGGSINTTPALVAPGYGGIIIGGAQGPDFYNPPVPSPQVPSAGASSTSGQFAGTGGGGGVASLTAAASPGFPGGPGSGGGGGGASLNGFASGAGGNGGDGFVIVEAYF